MGPLLLGLVSAPLDIGCGYRQMVLEIALVGPPSLILPLESDKIMGSTFEQSRVSKLEHARLHVVA